MNFMQVMHTPSGPTVLMNGTRNIRQYEAIQRPINDEHVLQLVRNWNWAKLGTITMHRWNPWVVPFLTKTQIKSYKVDVDNTYHVSNGQHRVSAYNILFPDGVFTQENQDRGLIPSGYRIGSPVPLTCQIAEHNPVDTFIGLNTINRVTDSEKFMVRVGGKFSKELSLYNLFTQQYKIRVTFTDKRGRGESNTTGGLHVLVKFWENDEQSVIDTAELITTIYKSGNIVDPSALSYSFMKGLCWAIINCKKLGYDIALIREALKESKNEDWPANRIIRHYISSGGGASIVRTRKVLFFMIDYYAKNESVPSEQEINDYIFKSE